MIILTPLWSNDLNVQLTARIWRQGQTSPVTIHNILAANTVDELVVQRVADKEQFDVMLLEHLKKRKT